MMEIQVKLMGALKAKSPPENRIEIPENSTINDVLQALDIESRQVQIVMVNDKPQPDRSRTVQPGDELTVLAPVGGG